MPDPADQFDVVALLEDLSDGSLSRGQVGTVVDSVDRDVALVEFSDDKGRTYAIKAVPRARLLVLRYVPAAA